MCSTGGTLPEEGVDVGRDLRETQSGTRGAFEDSLRWSREQIEETGRIVGRKNENRANRTVDRVGRIFRLFQCQMLQCSKFLRRKNLVEAGGIEPPSEGLPSPRLHA